MPNKIQITLTLEADHLSYLRTLAKTDFFDNASMAMGKIIKDHQEMTSTEVAD